MSQWVFGEVAQKWKHLDNIRYHKINGRSDCCECACAHAAAPA